MILLFCPLIGTSGQELVVVSPGVVGGVEEIFHVVEGDAVEHFFLSTHSSEDSQKEEEGEG